ncbi:hypothetical protein [Roseibium litorale]|uniref:Uncharacterized protein n=1 Tax=Roseibium litorale TaxID=2803841 RepID=A0ABR9CRQ1_9HYPH|nr:hypothetical protein [Roseibium litorale]MBD8893510.1 hypothetical protein [Roseibium litorale]
MLFTAYLAVCLSNVAIKDCNKDTALNWMVAPGENRGLAYCMTHGQRYAATSGVVHEGEYVKIYCKAPDQFTRPGVQRG